MRLHPKNLERRARDLRIFLLIFVAFLIACFWYVKAESIGDVDAPGTYTYAGNGQKVKLILTPDHLFTEKLLVGGSFRQAQGSWHTFGEGHIGFSKEFLPLNHEEICYGDETCGWLQNYFGFMTMELGLNRPGLRFTKRPF